MTLEDDTRRIVDSDDIPKPAPHYTPDDGDGEEKKQGGLKQLLMTIAPAALVLIFVFIQSGNYVLKSNNDKDMQAIGTDLSAIKGSVNALSSLSSQMSQITQEINTIRNGLGGYATVDGVNQLSSSLSAMQGELTTIKTNIANISVSQNEIESLQTSLADVTEQLESAQEELDDLGEQVAISVNITASVPIINTFMPLSGNAGTLVTINGTKLLGATSVKFGDTPASSYIVNSDNQITALVGNGADGLISVTTPRGVATSPTYFDYTGTITQPTPNPQGDIVASIVGSSTMSLSLDGTTVYISIANNSNKTIYAEQVNLTLRFLNNPPQVPTGLQVVGDLNAVPRSPSPSIQSGVVSYVLDCNAYMASGTTQTVSVILSAPLAEPINFTTTVAVVGYSAL